MRYVCLLLAAAVVHGEMIPYSRFCYFQDEPVLGGYFGNGYVVSGPFYANGPVCVWSTSPGRYNDPWFYSFTLTSDFYYYSQGTATGQASVPHVGNLWIEPYEMMMQGPPWFELGADPIPFGSDGVNWQAVRDSALTSGLFFTGAEVPDGCRILLRQDSLLLKTSATQPSLSFCLSALDCPVVWFDNGPDDEIFIRGYALSEVQRETEGLSVPLMIGGVGDFMLMGPHLYQNVDFGDPDNDVLLGLMSVHGDMVIADQPPAPDPWGMGWQIVNENYSGSALEFDCSMLALEGDFFAQVPWQPTPGVEWLLAGGIQMLAEGWTATSTSGYTFTPWYDPRLLETSPPCYPCYGDGTGTTPESSGQLTGPSLSVSGNPFHSSLRVTVEGCPGEAQLNLFDISGRSVWSGSVSGSVTIPTVELPPAAYVLHGLIPDGQTRSVLLVKL